MYSAPHERVQSNASPFNDFFAISNFRFFVIRLLHFAEGEFTKRVTKNRKFESTKKCSRFCPLDDEFVPDCLQLGIEERL